MHPLGARSVAIVCGLWLAISAHPVTAQAPPSPQNAPTLHVFVNVMQIPVLVLDRFRHPKAPVPPSRFQVMIKGVAPFTPTRVRLQGDDPISLAVLVDGSDPEEELWRKVGTAANELGTRLRPQDRVEIYAIDGCRMRRFLPESPFNAEQLRVSLSAAAETRSYAAQRKALGPCARPILLWDAMLYVASQLEQRKGRRILLAVSNGQQARGETLGLLHNLLNAASITLFAIQHGDVDVNAFAVQSIIRERMLSGAAGAASNDLFASFPPGPMLQMESELSGGILLGASLQSLPRTLANAIELARGRYIVEFPRPAQLGPGSHSIEVSIGTTRDFIRPAGISVPIATAEELAKDPLLEPAVAAPAAAKEPAAGEQPPPPTASTAPAAAAAPHALPAAPTAPPTQKPAPDPLDITDEMQPVTAQHP